MKKLFFAALFLMAATAQAEMVSVKKTKCSLFGNLKVKVSGLESFGKVGKGYLKANLPMRADCDAVLVSFKQRMGRGMTASTVDFDQYEVRREIDRGSDNDRKMVKRDYECEIYERSVINVQFAKFGSTEFKNTHDKLVGRYYGRCR